MCKPAKMREGIREDPTAHALVRFIGKAAGQLNAVNPDRAQPKFLMIVSRARLLGPIDLHLAIRRLSMPYGSGGFPLVDLVRKNSKRPLENKRELWKDTRTQSVLLVINKDSSRHRDACELVRIAL